MYLNPSMVDRRGIMDYSVNTLWSQQQVEFSSSFSHDNLSSNFNFHGPSAFFPVVHSTTMKEDVFDQRKKRKLMEQSTSNSQNSSPAASTTEFGGSTNTRKINNLGKRSKRRDGEGEHEKSEKVIHVRARRGQATDSHSLAERVRREKINEKMRCLQDLVPGCHKTMGMAMMLEEIINYVHSLQNQVEFLSMELAAACSSYDLSMATESTKKAQETSSYEVEEMEKWARDRYEENNCFRSTWSI